MKAEKNLEMKCDKPSRFNWFAMTFMMLTAVHSLDVAPARADEWARVREAVEEQKAAPAPLNDSVEQWIEENGERLGIFVKPGAVKDRSSSNSDFGSQNSVAPRPKPFVVQPKIKTLSESASGVELLPHVSTENLRLPERSADFFQQLEPLPVHARALGVDPKDAASEIVEVMNKLNFDGVCRNFASNGGFGAWGLTIVDELLRGNANSMLAGTWDIERACPNYDNLGIKERAYLWVWVLASKVFLESSCNPKAQKVTSKPEDKEKRVAAGLMQLHMGSESRYGVGCRNNDSLNPIRTIRCGISMLEDQIRNTGALFSKDSYWGTLRPQGDYITLKSGQQKYVDLRRPIVAGMRQLSFCQLPGKSVSANQSLKR